MYSTHDEGNPIFPERFTKALKVKSIRKMTANDSKSYLGYLNKLVHECNNDYHRSIGTVKV